MPSTRGNRKSSPAAGTATKAKATTAGRRQSRSKSSSPTAPAARKPRSRSSSRTRQPQPQKQEEKKPVAPVKRQPTPSRQRRSVATAAAANHSVEAASSTTATVVTTRSTTTTSSTVTSNVTSAASASASSSSIPGVRKPRSEFGGALGTGLMTLGLPLSLVLLSLISDGRLTLDRSYPWLKAPANKPSLDVNDFFSVRAALMYLGWIGVQLVLYCLPIGGRWVQHDGGRYHCNGLFALVVSTAGFGFAIWWGVPASRIICNEATRMAVFACLFSGLLSAALYIRSRYLPASALTAEAAAAASTAISGCGCCNAVYEFFMGRELHPRLGGGLLDLKFFLEMRPGLIGWALLDLAFAYQSSTNKIGLTSPMAHLTFMHLLYIADALFFERSILTTTDIKREGLGYMLSFGNLAWVPFFYSLSARQLVTHSPAVPIYCLVGVALFNIFGYWLFRFANRQKDLFRRDPHHPTFVGCVTVPTGVRGHNLLADGFWGRLRHPNFTGDLIMALAWSLAAGFHAPLAWLYPPYLLLLLVHRGMRDEAHCAKKYGLAWQRYCDLVPYRLVPRIF